MPEPKPRPIIPTADEAFASSLRARREAKGLTQEDLAKHMASRGFDFHQQTIYKIEKGARRVTVGEAVSLAEAVGQPIEVLADRFPDSEESLAINMRRNGRDYAEYLFNTISHMQGLKMAQVLFQQDLRDYYRVAKLSVDRGDENKVVDLEIWEPLALFAGINDYWVAWTELIRDERVREVLRVLGWDPEEMDDSERVLF